MKRLRDSDTDGEIHIGNKSELVQLKREKSFEEEGSFIKHENTKRK